MYGPKRTEARVMPGTAALAMAPHRRPCAATRSLQNIIAGRWRKADGRSWVSSIFILAYHVSPGHYLLVVPVVLYHFSTAQPIGRRCHCRGSSTPQSSCPAAASSLLGGGSRPGPAGIGQNGQPKWRPESFFSFLRCEVEIPRRREVEIPLRTRRLWLRPHYEEVPAQPTFRAFSRPKWRGCSPFSFFGYIHVSVDLA
jgi:hypothetical protein